jgi:hypothetical protein
VWDNLGRTTNLNPMATALQYSYANLSLSCLHATMPKSYSTLEPLSQIQKTVLYRHEANRIIDHRCLYTVVAHLALLCLPQAVRDLALCGWCNALNTSSALLSSSSPIKSRPLTASPPALYRTVNNIYRNILHCILKLICTLQYLVLLAPGATATTTTTIIITK